MELLEKLDVGMICIMVDKPSALSQTYWFFSHAVPPQFVLKVFDNAAKTETERKADMEAELNKMVRAEIQVKDSKNGGRVPEPTFWTNELPSGRDGQCFPAIEMAYCGGCVQRVDCCVAVAAWVENNMAKFMTYRNVQGWKKVQADRSSHEAFMLPSPPRRGPQDPVARSPHLTSVPCCLCV